MALYVYVCVYVRCIIVFSVSSHNEYIQSLHLFNAKNNIFPSNKGINFKKLEMSMAEINQNCPEDEHYPK